MSARSKARKQTLDLLYESDIRGSDLLELLASRDVEEVGPDARPIREYTKSLIEGIYTHKRKIDELIRVPLSKQMLFDRLENCTITAVMARDTVEFGVEQDAVSTVNAEGIIIV